MRDKQLRNLFLIAAGGLAVQGCSPKESETQDEQKPQTEVVTPQVTPVDDPYGNVVLFEATRSKIKFALAFCENYYEYVYFCGEAWTAGHGLTILYNADGSYTKVKTDMTAPTLEQSDIYKGRYLTHEILPDIKSCIKVPMDENTMIAACVLRYCIGHSNFVKSQFVKQLNAGVKGAALAKTLTGWRQQDGVPKRCYFFAALMAGKIQYSDLLDLRAEGCYNLTWKDIFVYNDKGGLKVDKNGFCEWDFSKVRKNLETAKNPKTTRLTLNGKKHVSVECKLTKEIVPNYIWQEVSNGRAAVVAAPQNTTDFATAEQSYTCAQLNDSSYIAYNAGDYETALETGKAALQLAQTNKEVGAANYNIGMAYLAMGKYERAVKYLRLSLAANKTKAAEGALKEAMQKRQSTRTNCGGCGLLGAGALTTVLIARRRSMMQKQKHR